MASEPIIHVTLNTGDSRHSPRGEVRDEVIEALRPLVRKNGGLIPGFAAPYHVTLLRAGRDAVFTIYAAAQPVLTCGLARDDPAHTWHALTLMFEELPYSYRATRPVTTPWLGVVLLPAVILIPRHDLYALADFERVMAWTIIEEVP